MGTCQKIRIPKPESPNQFRTTKCPDEEKSRSTSAPSLFGHLVNWDLIRGFGFWNSRFR